VDFCLGFYKHPHPQIASDLLVSGRLYLAVATCVWPRAPRAASLGARLAQEPEIRLVGDDPMRQAIDEIAQRLGSPAGPGIQVQTSRLALELVRLGMGWTVVDFLTATRLDPAQMVAMELPDLPPMSLYSYHASAHPPGLHATRMLTMLPGLLHAALSPHTRK
jgi:DNA-binding transcriptional LysR family regulator